MVTSVTVLNVLEVKALELAQWVSANILNVSLPEHGPNRQINVEAEIMPLLSITANRLVFTTELYIICMGAKTLATKGVDDVMSVASINAKIDILYRTIQALEASRSTAISIRSSMQYKAQHNI